MSNTANSPVTFHRGYKTYTEQGLDQHPGALYFDLTRHTIHLNGVDYYPVDPNDKILVGYGDSIKSSNIGYLQTKLSVKKVTKNEDSSIPSSVRDRYKIIGNDPNNLIGFIDIPADNQLRHVYIGSNKASAQPDGNGDWLVVEEALAEGSTYPDDYIARCLNFVYNIDGENKLVSIPLSDFFTDVEAGKGLTSPLNSSAIDITLDNANATTRYIDLKDNSIGLKDLLLTDIMSTVKIEKDTDNTQIDIEVTNGSIVDTAFNSKKYIIKGTVTSANAFIKDISTYTYTGTDAINIRDIFNVSKSPLKAVSDQYTISANGGNVLVDMSITEGLARLQANQKAFLDSFRSIAYYGKLASYTSSGESLPLINAAYNPDTKVYTPHDYNTSDSFNYAFYKTYANFLGIKAKVEAVESTYDTTISDLNTRITRITGETTSPDGNTALPSLASAPLVSGSKNLASAIVTVANQITSIQNLLVWEELD